MGQLEMYLITYMRVVYARLRAVRDQAGYTTETVIMTATLATLAIAVAAILIAKVLDKANSIDLSGSGGS